MKETPWLFNLHAMLFVDSTEGMSFVPPFWGVWEGLVEGLSDRSWSIVLRGGDWFAEGLWDGVFVACTSGGM